ncbi:enoyl-CoA hydratase/isomerase family protein (plasmid) [Deinococcus metallilatus]|uniref:Enoyl-CoA hydratase/carnithine racemase n=1 Tax=Deinococcus metallilatus TaxID=1211322 RepID=A0AAJ5F7S2_9DEIO|nr:enoyl-CoA hydratase/isomerase family protein [Deinococcus metallilatus]MBB5293366.1 enoyl-CoA hydratase/carnithine racemase [Deinococcus metallilatus]QBY06471.1 enoyl-CoA hydratase/isomerase family protein [Deinococcus metallilatus]RXJ17814.1 enoyl-CoA hydratase/isomerase family protein [Deinococcus metallilatus]TLK32086.1 enoyl-CoA hydratase/isomerase family protein [Deinococcus metallilatus]GMA15411.1 crotonase [Deinococcus metallilatus]
MPVTFTQEGKLGFITLDNPPANSYDINFMRELDRAIDEADASDANVIVLRSGSEKFFSAGADIKTFAASTTAQSMDMIRTAHAALEKMAASDKLFIAAINGHALGGGLEMALAADLRLAKEGKYLLGLPEVTLGVLPGNGGTQRLPRLIGVSKALEMMVNGERVSPEEALRLGLVNKLLPAENFDQSVRDYAQKLADGPTLAIGAIKRAVYDGFTRPLHDGLALERELIEPLYDTTDAKEGFAAFGEKRQPVYQGK